MFRCHTNFKQLESCRDKNSSDLEMATGGNQQVTSEFFSEMSVDEVLLMFLSSSL